MFFFIIVANIIILLYLIFREESKGQTEITSEEHTKRHKLESDYWSDRDTIRIRERFGDKFNSQGLTREELLCLSYHAPVRNSEVELMSGDEIISLYAKMKKEKTDD